MRLGLSDAKFHHGQILQEVHEVAQLFHVSASTVRRRWAKGAIPRPLQAGGSGCALRWISAQIEAFIAEQLGENEEVLLTSDTIG